MSHIKLNYFDIRVIGEPIRLLFHYMGKEFEDFRVPRDQWPAYKKVTPFGKMPVLEIDGKVYCQSIPMLRYLAHEAGLTGNNPEENYEIDMIVAAFGDLVSEVSRHFKAHLPQEKEIIRQGIINDVIPFYMEKLEKVVKKNGGYLANGKLSWAEFFVVGYSSSLPGLIGVDLTEKYPFFKELTDKVHSLPGIKEWIKIRPKTPL